MQNKETVHKEVKVAMTTVHQIENTNKEIENIKINQVKILELKHSMIKIKNFFFLGRIDQHLILNTSTAANIAVIQQSFIRRTWNSAQSFWTEMVLHNSSSI